MPALAAPARHQPRKTKVTEEIDLSVGLCHAFCTDVWDMNCVATKFVLKLLNFDQKNPWMSVAQKLLNDVNN